MTRGLFTYILNRIEFAMRAAIAFEATMFALGAWWRRCKGMMGL
jgi:hypothetical protein